MSDLNSALRDAQQAIQEASLMRLPDVCRRLNVDRKTVYKLIEAKLLPCSRIPGVGRRFERADVEALIEKHRVA